MNEPNPTEIRALRAAAHHLNPVVSISQKGLTAGVLNEIDRSLKAHELIKLRLYGIDREARPELIGEICSTLKCVEVQHIGNLLVLWRQRPADDNAKSALAGRRPTRNAPRTKKQAAAALERKR
jgi:putative YhbY family RNA-binding protein